MTDEDEAHDKMLFHFKYGIKLELTDQFQEARKYYKKAYKIANRYNFIYYLPTITENLKNLEIMLEKGHYEHEVDLLEPKPQETIEIQEPLSEEIIKKKEELKPFKLQEFKKIKFHPISNYDPKLIKKLNRKTRKVLQLSPQELMDSTSEELEKYFEYTNSDRLSFRTYLRAEAEIRKEIEKRIRYIETIINIRRENRNKEIINTTIIKPIKKGFFDDIINFYSRTKDSEGAAERAYSRFSKEKLDEQGITRQFYMEEFVKKIEDMFNTAKPKDKEKEDFKEGPKDTQINNKEGTINDIYRGFGGDGHKGIKD